MAIIGAGWYGCHIGATLQALGLDVTVFERRMRPLHEASGNNQFRLHLGFHYPRHYATRMQSRDGFGRFVERYPNLSRPATGNIYAVCREESLLDFLTYRLILTSSGIEFTEPPALSFTLDHTEGHIDTSERVILLGRARRYFQGRLGTALVLGHEVTEIEETEEHVRVDGGRYDLLIDASWGHFRPPPMPIFYEPTLLLYYEAQQPFPAVTLVDGPLCSIYPTEDPGVFTLSSVPHTPLGQFASAAQASAARDRAGLATVAEKRALMERQIARYLPAFGDHFRFLDPQFSIKTKPFGRHDDRSCTVHKRGRIISVMSGKIDTIFYATERVLSLIEAAHQPASDPVEPLLRRHVLGGTGPALAPELVTPGEQCARL